MDLLSKKLPFEIEVDINKDYVKECRRALKEHNVYSKVNLFVADANALCFKDKCFDTSFLIDVLEHLSDLVSALKRLKW